MENTMKTLAKELFSKVAPVTKAGKFFQFPLIRILIVIGFLLPVLVLNKVVKMNVMPALPGNSIIVARYIEAIVFFLLFLWAFKLYARYIEKRVAFEIPAQNWFADTGYGFLIAIGMVVLVVLVLFFTGCFAISGVIDYKRFVFDLFVKFFMGAFLEELLFRLIIFKLTEELLGTWIALAIQALLFGFAHSANDNATLFTSFAVAIVGGWLYSAAYIYSRSIWLPLGLHWGWNFIQSGVFGMPNSGSPYQGLFIPLISGPEWLTGGAFGIEASYLTILLCLIAGSAFLFLGRKNSQLVLPIWSRKKGGE